MTGRIQAVTAKYREQLLQREAKAEQALNTAHKNTLAVIQPHLDTLYRQIAEKQSAGESVPVSWLYEGKRLETTKQLISGQVNHYAALAQMTVGQLQHQGIALGTQLAQAQLEASVPMTVNWSFGDPSPAAIANMVGVTGDGSPLADLFDKFGTEAAQAAANALIQGVTLGSNPRTIAPLIEEALEVSRWRALTIARTEMLRSYRSAALENYKANSDVVSKWRWTCAKSDRTCAACLAMDGTLHDLDEDMGTHPNCRCVQAPVAKGWDDILGPLGIDTSGIEDARLDIQSGEDWFNEQDEGTQRRILGNAGYKAWSENDGVTLKDFVGKSSNPDWGDSIYQRSAKQVLAKK